MDNSLFPEHLSLCMRQAGLSDAGLSSLTGIMAASIPRYLKRGKYAKTNRVRKIHIERLRSRHYGFRPLELGVFRSSQQYVQGSCGRIHCVRFIAYLFTRPRSGNEGWLDSLWSDQPIQAKDWGEICRLPAIMGSGVLFKNIMGYCSQKGMESIRWILSRD